MRFVVISGMDGSGKTTVIEALRDRLEKRGIKTHYVWMRYTHILCKPVHGLCRLIGFSKAYDTRMGKVWRHEFYRSQMFCSFYIVIAWLDTWLGSLRLCWKLKDSEAEVVICDRWVNDVLVDLTVKSHRLGLIDSNWYTRFQGLQPGPIVQFVIERDARDILECRLENQDDPAFVLRQNAYEMLTKNKCAVRIDNTETVDYSVEQILRHLIA